MRASGPSPLAREAEPGAVANHKVEALSKGMAQKIQFISAVIANPQLLILDERSPAWIR